MKSLLHFQWEDVHRNVHFVFELSQLYASLDLNHSAGQSFQHLLSFVLCFPLSWCQTGSIALVFTKELLSPVTRRPQHQHVQIQSFSKERGVRVRKLSSGTLSSWGFGAFLEGRSSMSQFQCSSFLVWALLRNPSDSQPTPLQTAEKVLVFSVSHNNT